MKKDYYLFNSGELKRNNDTLLFIGTDSKKKFIPINDVDDIYIFSHVNFNVELINFISSNNINIHFFDYYGNYTSTLYSKDTLLSGNVRINQASKYLNEEDRLYIAKEFLNSAFNTINKNLQDYSIDINIDDFITRLESSNLKNIMSVEAEFRKKYYSYWDNGILKNLKFEKRTRRPPENEINALISFGNSMCYSLCMKKIKETYLDSTISFLHEPSERRHSLSLDLAEIFKPLFVDRVIFNLVNNRIIKPDDFVKIGTLCYLNDNGKKKFITEYQKKLETTIFIQKLNRNVSYQSLVRLECYKLIKHFTEDKKYKSLKIYW